VRDKILFRELEHTGDLAIEVTAASAEELFAHALLAIAWLMVVPDNIEARERRVIRFPGRADDETMHELLSRALRIFLIDNFIWCESEVSLQEPCIMATLAGERFDPARHQLLEEIKAVTYHRLVVNHTDDGWRGVVVFDA